jgi:hypothetical protein
VHIDGIDDASRLIFVDRILHHYQIARSRHGEVRLSGDDQRKLLQIGGDAHLRLGPAGHHLTKVNRPALGRDGPQHIGQVFDAEAVRGHETLEFSIDVSLSLAGDIRLSFSLGQETSAGETDLCAPAAVPVIDSRNIPPHNLDAVERNVIAIAVLCRHDRLLLLWLCGRIRLLRVNGTRGSAKQGNEEQSSSGHLVELRF